MDIQLPTVWTIRIIGTITRNEQRSAYIEYQVRVVSVLGSWLVQKRYSDFLGLHSTLKTNYPSNYNLSIPPKRLVGSSMSRKFVEKRRKDLDLYLRQLLIQFCFENAFEIELRAFLHTSNTSFVELESEDIMALTRQMLEVEKVVDAREEEWWSRELVLQWKERHFLRGLNPELQSTPPQLIAQTKRDVTRRRSLHISLQNAQENDVRTQIDNLSCQEPEASSFKTSQSPEKIGAKSTSISLSLLLDKDLELRNRVEEVCIRLEELQEREELLSQLLETKQWLINLKQSEDLL